MEIIEVTKKEFNNVIFNPFHVYGMGDFNNINKHKCKSIHYLLFKESKFRLGLVGGIIDNTFLSSFSAPFGGFLFIKESIAIEYMDEAIDLVIEWGKTQNLESIKLTLPPPVYNESFITKQVNSLYRKGFQTSNIELNYIFFTEKFNNDYLKSLDRKSRNNLNNALKQDLRFHKCEELEEKKLAYDIVEEHKKFKKYPMRMTWEQVFETTNIIEADFFLLYHNEDIPVASAMVYHVSESIVQIIYWGDDRNYANLRTMNFLAYKIFEYYYKLNYKIIDLGPSSENSIPNIGLCRFKENIGCDITTKMSFEYKFS